MASFYFSKLLEEMVGAPCLDVSYDSFVTQLKETSWEKNPGMLRQWVYQTCVEFGYYQVDSMIIVL